MRDKETGKREGDRWKQRRNKMSEERERVRERARQADTERRRHGKGSKRE